MRAKTVGDELLLWIKEGLEFIGIPHDTLVRLDKYIYLVIIPLIAWLVGKIIHWMVTAALRRIIKHRTVTLISKLIEYNALRKLSYIIPPLIVLALLPFAFGTTPILLDLLERLTWIYFTIVITVSSNAVLKSIGSAAFSREKNHDRPVKGFIQIMQIAIVCIAIIIIVSIVVNRSPMYLITGLGAFAAILILVFKDSLLGLVGGALLLQNDMVRLGDWIEMPDNNINGVVTDIALTIIKVQNFDNTIVTVPPYSLISGSFTNWRGMSESGGRRIMLQIDLMYDYIKPCTPEFLEQMKNFNDELGRFIDLKQQQAAQNQVANTNNPAGVVNGTIDTNAGVFRVYMTLYIKNHPLINKDMLYMVRVERPNHHGLPLQLYCFTNTTEWVAYESILSEIMEHYISVMPRFGLFAAQDVSSRDHIIGNLLMGKATANDIATMPYNTLKEEQPEDTDSV